MLCSSFSFPLKQNDTFVKELDVSLNDYDALHLLHIYYSRQLHVDTDEWPKWELTGKANRCAQDILSLQYYVLYSLTLTGCNDPPL